MNFRNSIQITIFEISYMKILAFILLILVMPLYLSISISLLIFGRGGVMFKQTRVGENKLEFIIWKFRTMSDNKVTPFGRILRKLGLDEIPQLLNIVRGDMAFVGPRPLTQYDIDRLEWNDDKYIGRWSVKPGITGAAQLVMVCDKNVSMREDLNYVSEKCFSLDVKIFIKSMLVPFIGKGVKK